MPTVVNGIGTWYYGKKRIHRLKNVCSFCNRAGELESFDTTLYFVVFFVPLVPLGRKRVLQQCPSCQKHRVISLQKWEVTKAQDIARLLEELRAKPDDGDTIRAAIALASSYQDEVLLDKLAPALAGHRLEDGAIQAQLGVAYSYFARHEEAEAAFRASLAAQDSPAVREQLALSLLRQHRPEEAYAYLRHILDDRRSEGAGMIYLLAEAYQAEGMHKEALELMDRRDTLFPELAISKDYLRQRKTSERYLHSGKKIRSAFLSESSKAGYREGSWMASVPRFIGPLVLLGLLGWYLGAAVWMGQARKIYLVSGWNQPYTVAVNGQEEVLQPGAVTPLRIREGQVAIELRDPNVVLEPDLCRVETPFFSRPFRSDTFVINPDHLAIVVLEQSEYSATPRPAQEPPRLLLGDGFYSFHGIDYEFSPFPPTLQAEKGQTIRKTRVTLAPNLTSEQKLSVAGRVLDEKGQMAYAQRLVRLDATDVYPLYWVLGKLTTDEAVEFLKPRLADRPMLVEWHRAYQHFMDKGHPERDLRPEYQQLVAESKGHPDALYLLARLQDVDEADTLLRQAAGATPPSVPALHALGFRALAEGRFANALGWLQKAVRLSPDHPAVRADYESTLLAGGGYDQLLEELKTRSHPAGQNLAVSISRLRAYAAKRDEAAAQATIEEAVQSVQGPEKERYRAIVRAAMEMILCSRDNDVDGYLTRAAQMPDARQYEFEQALWQGKLQEAAGAVDRTKDDQALTQYALLYLAALEAGNPKLAQQQWQLLLACLERLDRYSRQLGAMLAGRQPLNVHLIRRLPIEPREKRVLLAIVAQRDPDEAQELLSLARSLNFYLDGTSLCLRKILEKSP
jgi:tetratricopeptide (TPR) repeat protein